MCSKRRVPTLPAVTVEAGISRFVGKLSIGLSHGSSIDIRNPEKKALVPQVSSSDPHHHHVRLDRSMLGFFFFFSCPNQLQQNFLAMCSSKPTDGNTAPTYIYYISITTAFFYIKKQMSNENRIWIG
jgi:hypothetical protein